MNVALLRREAPVAVQNCLAETEAADRFEAGRGAISPVVARFLDYLPYDGPRVVVDLEMVAAAYRRLVAGLNPARIFYAVKANPDRKVLSKLHDLGANFDVASKGEISLCLSLGIEPDRLSFGNTIKKEADIAWAFARGVRLFAFDSAEELAKLARQAPGAEVFCRLVIESSAADWPLSRKFGCAPEMAETLLLAARDKGLKPVGLSFHVGSQMRSPEGWRDALAQAALVWKRLALRGLRLELLNLGGGFPATYTEAMLPMQSYAARVIELVAEYFGTLPPRMIAEPGRGLVAEAGVIEAEVVLVSRKAEGDSRRWVYLDIGKFGGLAETMDEAIRYRIETTRDGSETGPCILAGPTCDSADVLYEKTLYYLPIDLQAGDRVRIPSCGAYTTTYSAVAFNGFAPLAAYAL